MNTETKMRMLLSCAVVAAAVAAGSPASASASPCQYARQLAGEGMVAIVVNQNRNESYKTYLVRNDERASNGILNDKVMYELIPARWGMDIRNPAGQRFAQINRENGEWVVHGSSGNDRLCHTKVVIRMGEDGTADIYAGRRHVGSIANFPSEEMEP